MKTPQPPSQPSEETESYGSFPNPFSAVNIVKYLAIGFSVLIGGILVVVAFSLFITVIIPVFLIGAAISLWNNRKSLSFHKIRSFFRRSEKKYASTEKVAEEEVIDI